MVSYPELVKKAKELHEKLGENEFRKRYEKHPSALIGDTGLHVSRFYRHVIGPAVLQAFPFCPLHESHKAVYENILKKREEHPLHVKTLGLLGKKAREINESLAILEARGLVKTRIMRVGKAPMRVVTKIFDGKEWKTAVLP